MANHKMYFGTKNYMTWIPCPAINAGLGSSRWITTGGFLNGGAYQRQSSIGSKRYGFSWNPQVAEDMYEFLSFFDGIHGEGPFYFIDPFAAKSNVLPSFVASPVTMAGDAPTFGGTQRISRVSTGASAFGYPTQSAQWTIGAGYGPYKNYSIPVPAGYTLHLGVHGSASGSARVIARNTTTAVATTLPMMSTDTAVRTNTALAGGTWYDVTVLGEGTLTLTGLIGQILPDGEVPQTGNFISGQGNTGVRLASDPTVTGYSAALDNASIGVSAEFVETGAWEQ